MPTRRKIYKLKGIVQNYTWGGFDFIPDLLGIKNTEKKPFAEYWLGAHPNHSSTFEIDGQESSLQRIINENKREVLGESVSKKFGSLPYLYKVLDVRQMLSIQVHPNKKSAEENFQKENAAGIPVNAPNRNYKDDNHKPELMVALSDFWLLHGFKPLDKLKRILSEVPEFNFLLDAFNEGGYKTLYSTVMTMQQQKINEILHPLLARILPLYKNGELKKDQEHFWAARAAETFCKKNNYDRGIFSIYFFNLVHLKKGEGIYQAAQLPHAYLEGQNVEVMANSDNVLRAGLTDKHIDIDELLKHVKFEETHPQIIGSPSVKEHMVYPSPAEEFEIEYYSISTEEEKVNQSTTPEIILVIEGEIKIISDEEIILQKGEAAFIFADTHYSLSALSPGELFKVSVPQKQT